MTANPRFLFFPLLFLFAGTFLSSCGIVKTSVSEEARGVIASGTASWYGPDFHGKLTANGEVYNMNELTAAHRTLPFNTIVRVDNLDNNKSVVVRINDRGPYVGNRVIDLSRKAAEEIDMISSGTAPVRILLVEEGDRPLNSQNVSSRETFTVQIASFERESEAKAKASTIDGARVERVTIAGRRYFRVYYGSYRNTEDAHQARRDLAGRGINGFVKQAEN